MLKKFFFLLVSILVSGVCAEEQVPSFTPKEHRGFYNSVGFGIGYNSFHAKEQWQDLDHYYADEKEKETYDFTGATFPVFDFKFGTALANLIAFHTSFNFAIYSGSMDYEDVEYEREIAQDEHNDPLYDDHGNKIYKEDWQIDYTDKYSGDAVNIRTFIGFGTTIYPFQDPNSAMNGFFIGGSVGYVFYVAVTTDDNHATGNLGTSFIAEIGKDWWINNHMSIGVGFSFGHSSTKFDEIKSSENVFALSFRLTRG